MSMKRWWCLLALTTICLLAKASDKGWQKVENSFYSLELPSQWKPQNGMPGDGTEPGTRDARGFHLHYFVWCTPVKTREEIPDCIGIDIQSYEKIDKTPVSVRDIETMVILASFSSFPSTKTEIFSSEDELQLIVLQDSKEMDGSTVRYRRYCLLKQAGIGVHFVEVSCRDELVKRKPETEKMIKRILKSFAVKKVFK